MSDKKKLLVVDDDPDFLLQQKVQLEAAGYEVIEAGAVEEAEEKAAAGGFDAAIVDLMMGDADSGFQFSYHLKKKHPNLPVIIVTAVASETGIEFEADTEEERSWIKADVILAKPIRFEQLQRELERLLQE